MDWYLIGRILGLLFWPALVALVLYGIGWAIAVSRPPHVSVNVKRWFRTAAVLAFIGTLIFTGHDFLRYAGLFS